MDRLCLPKTKARPLTSEDIAVRKLQARQRHAELMLKQEQEKSEVSEANQSESTAPSGDVVKGVEGLEIEDAGPVFIAFARVFSGTLRKGQDLYVLGPKYDPATMKNVSVDPSLTLKVSDCITFI